jgi:hypothetical protein
MRRLPITVLAKSTSIRSVTASAASFRIDGRCTASQIKRALDMSILEQNILYCRTATHPPKGDAHMEGTPLKALQVALIIVFMLVLVALAGG